MRFLGSVRWRLFLTVWIVYTVHFATNVVREHYPAFSLVDHLSLEVDEYLGFHADIFQHRDGHSYVGNNVAVSVLAAIPLLVFDPVLDALERYSANRRAAAGVTDLSYRTDKPNRVRFFQLVKERGLELRFGGATLVTSAFLMAPLSALAVVLMFHLLTLRGVGEPKAAGLSLLFAFGTPMFFRTAPLNPNMFVTYATFLGFYLLWVRPGAAFPISLGRRVGAGLLGGFALAADYSGVVSLLALYGYLFFNRLGTGGWRTAFRESLVFVAAGVPPVLFLWFSQWSMYGHPFMPGQYWMPPVNFTDQGWRGFSWPTADLFWLNLFDPTYGMLTFGPILLLGLIPAFRYPAAELILPRRDRRFVAGLVLFFLVFCAANQYSRMQFNSGFRYLAPLVPLLFLAGCDHLVRLSRMVLYSLVGVVVVHSWVLAAARESVPDSWRMVLTDGIQLPWLTVLRKTLPPEAPVVSSTLLPIGILGLTVAVVGALWWHGSRLQRQTTERSL